MTEPKRIKIANWDNSWLRQLAEARQADPRGGGRRYATSPARTAGAAMREVEPDATWWSPPGAHDLADWTILRRHEGGIVHFADHAEGFLLRSNFGTLEIGR